jgi:hypothetical protein
MKMVAVLCASPQFIYSGFVNCRFLCQRDAGEVIQEFKINTGQHFDANMSDIF